MLSMEARILKHGSKSRLLTITSETHMSTRSVNSIEKRFCAHARAKGNSCSLAVHVAMMVVFDIGGGGVTVVGSGP